MIETRTGEDRTEPPLRGTETETLIGFLRWQRETFAWKCSGVDLPELAEHKVGSSNLTLLGLIRHMADVERGWFRRRLAGEDAPPRFWSKERPDGEFDVGSADQAMVDEALAAWREEVRFAEHCVEAAPNLDVTADDPPWREGLSLRWIMVHMIEEYARHNGHVDLIREDIDGLTGE